MRRARQGHPLSRDTYAVLLCLVLTVAEFAGPVALWYGLSALSPEGFPVRLSSGPPFFVWVVGLLLLTLLAVGLVMWRERARQAHDERERLPDNVIIMEHARRSRVRRSPAGHWERVPPRRGLGD